MTLTALNFILLIPAVYITDYLFSMQIKKKKWLKSYLVLTFNNGNETVTYKLKYQRYSQASDALVNISEDIVKLTLALHKGQREN